MEVTALLLITYATNCTGQTSWANGDKEQSCIVTRAIYCNHHYADGSVVKFNVTEDWAHYMVKYNAAGQVIEQSPYRLANPPAPRPGITPLTVLPIAPNPPPLPPPNRMILLTNDVGDLFIRTNTLPHFFVPPGFAPLNGIRTPPILIPFPKPWTNNAMVRTPQIPGAPILIPPPPTPLEPLPARRAVP